ncbi:MAG: hypothetical protein A3K68_07590 [Euryarchaeota archaeon RBG_16_68_13]|nr:MAG: hypothetical protein A3K68_07590 [Euryarchaeota archaeon RBG_16_68_13]
MDNCGAPVFEYAPLPMSPMTVAELLLLAVVTLAAPVALPSEFWPLGGVCFLPLLAVAAWAVLQSPSRTRIRASGIEVSLPLWRRLLRQRAWFPWSDVRNVYPASYELAGSALSPFASSAGTLVHTGLGLEMADGGHLVVKFTPGSIRRFRAESPGYTYAMEAVRTVFRHLGRPLVTDARAYTDAEVLAMHEEARRPLIGMGTIVFAFFLPPTIVALGTLAAGALGLAADLTFLLAVVALAAIPPLASMQFTLGKSRRRNRILGELAKHEETMRTGGA